MKTIKLDKETMIRFNENRFSAMIDELFNSRLGIRLDWGYVRNFRTWFGSTSNN